MGETMTAFQIVKLHLLTIPIFFIIDLLWLGVIAKGIYQKYLGAFLSDQVNWTAAIIFYLIFIPFPFYPQKGIACLQEPTSLA